MQRKIAWVLFLALLATNYSLLVTDTYAEEETLTITTYYPSPYGSYNQLQTNFLGVGDNDPNGNLDENDSPPIDGSKGSVWIAGNVGIGIGTTGPGARLQARGVIEGGSGSGIDPFLVEMYDGVGSSYPIIRCQDTGDIFLRPYPASPGNFDLQAYNSLGVAYSLIRLQNSNTSAIPNLQLQPNGGNVGIGTTQPSKLLHVYRNSTDVTQAMLMLEEEGSGDPWMRFLTTGATSWSVGIDNSDSDKFKISAGSSVDAGTALTIQTDGKVGIGTTSPSSGLELDVEGKVGATSYCDEDGNNCKNITEFRWVEITSDTNNFDVTCEYRWVDTENNHYFYPTYVSNDTISMDYSGGNYKTVNKSNKAICTGDTGTEVARTFKRCGS